MHDQVLRVSLKPNSQVI